MFQAVRAVAAAVATVLAVAAQANEKNHIDINKKIPSKYIPFFVG